MPVIKISGPGSTTTTGQTRRADRGGRRDGEFARLLDAGSAGAAAPVESATPLAAVDALLAAQCVPDSLDEEGRRRAVRHGEDILQRLEEIRLGLLAGGLPRDRLIDLARMVRSRRDRVGDPRLAAVLDEIELRAEVELAKYAQAR
jgi:hypothetical protein